MDEKVRIRVSLLKGEVELEGSEEFVNKQLDELKDLFTRIYSIYSELGILDKLGSVEVLKPPLEKPSVETGETFISGEISVPDTFGEWFNKFPKNLQNDDVALIAAFFAQENSDKKEFKTSDVTRILKEYGKIISNPAQYMKRLSENKLIFPTRRTGNVKTFRISKPDGIDKLKELMRGGNDT